MMPLQLISSQNAESRTVQESTSVMTRLRRSFSAQDVSQSGTEPSPRDAFERRPSGMPLPRVSMDTSVNLPAYVSDTWVAAPQNDMAEQDVRRLSTINEGNRDENASTPSASPELAYEEFAQSSRRSQDTIRGLYLQRGSSETIRQKPVWEDVPLDALTPPPRNSVDVIDDYLCHAKSRQVVRDVILSYTLGNAGSSSEQARLAATCFATLRRGVAFNDPGKRDIMISGFMDAYQCTMEHLALFSRAPSVHGEGDSETEELSLKNVASRSVAKVSSLFRQANAKREQVGRSLSSLSIRSESRASLRDEQPEMDADFEDDGGSSRRSCDAASGWSSNLKKMASSVDLPRLSRSLRPPMPRSFSSGTLRRGSGPYGASDARMPAASMPSFPHF